MSTKVVELDIIPTLEEAVEAMYKAEAAGDVEAFADANIEAGEARLADAAHMGTIDPEDRTGMQEQYKDEAIAYFNAAGESLQQDKCVSAFPGI